MKSGLSPQSPQVAKLREALAAIEAAIQKRLQFDGDKLRLDDQLSAATEAFGRLAGSELPSDEAIGRFQRAWATREMLAHYKLKLPERQVAVDNGLRSAIQAAVAPLQAAADPTEFHRDNVSWLVPDVLARATLDAARNAVADISRILASCAPPQPQYVMVDNHPSAPWLGQHAEIQSAADILSKYAP